MKPLTMLLVLLSVSTTDVRAEDKRPPRWVRDPALGERIDQSIALGVDYLRKIQLSDGRWTYHNRPLPSTPGRLREPGRVPKPRVPTPRDHRRSSSTTRERDAGLTALVLYALSVSGVPKDDPDIVEGLEWVAQHPRDYDTGSSLGTYATSLLILALTRIDPVEHGSTIRILADRIVKGQGTHGMWSYKLRPPRADGPSRSAGDNSNTQFAVLALWAAHSLAGHNAPRATWGRVERLYRRTQLRDGAWPYNSPPPKQGFAQRIRPGTATMTGAGLVSFLYASAAIHRSEPALHNARQSPQVKAAFRAFSRFLKKPDWDDLYLVYTVERVGTVLGTRDLSWYETGCVALCDRQLEQGNWKDSGAHGDGRHAYATSLALLFLGRGTLPPRRGELVPAQRVEVLTAKERRPTMQSEKSHRRAFEIYMTLPPEQRVADAAAFGARGKDFVDIVVLALASDGRAAARAAAHEILEVLLGQRFLYDARAGEDDRKVMTKLIVDTWHRMRAKAVWDSRARHYISR